MKKLFLIAIIVVGFARCEKENKEYCYECDFAAADPTYTGNRGYQDAGCMKPSDWRDLRMTDQYGREFDKDRYCRKK